MLGTKTFEFGLASMLPIFSWLELDSILRVPEVITYLQPERDVGQPRQGGLLGLELYLTLEEFGLVKTLGRSMRESSDPI